jgi:hypothetical protein
MSTFAEPLMQFVHNYAGDHGETDDLFFCIVTNARSWRKQ